MSNVEVTFDQHAFLEQLAGAHEEALGDVAEIARATAPYRSGEYAGNIETTTAVVGDTVQGRLGSTVPYARKVERRHHTMRDAGRHLPAAFMQRLRERLPQGGTR